MSLVLRDLGQEYAMWDALIQVSSEVHPKSYLEIGSRYGDSLLRVIMSTKLERIAIADIWDVSWFGPDSGSGTLFDRSHAHIERMLTHFGFSPEQVTYLDGDSRDTVPTLLGKQTFDMALVDGDHDFNKPDSFTTDMKNAWALVNPGGYMICDDVNEKHMHDKCEAFYKSQEDVAASYWRNGKKWGVCVIEKKG